MIIGQGIIARSLLSFSMEEGLVLFAGSINDSTINDTEIIRAEEIAVMEALLRYPDDLFIYFSSCSIADHNASHTLYVQHKSRMEALIRATAIHFLIFRLPQIVGFGSANSNLVKYLVNVISNHNVFELWENAKKNIIDIDDACSIIRSVLNSRMFSNAIINVANTSHTLVIDLVHDIEEFTGHKAKYISIQKNTGINVDVSDIQAIVECLDIRFDGDYIKRLLKKYFRNAMRRPTTICRVCDGTMSEV
jgi:nucleoside-diphosphate-sugar epimerase